MIVTLKGLHPNTSDETVIEYLALFGDVVSKKVIYSVYSSGPLMGLKTGDRSYKLEPKSPANLGSYHVLDGQRVTLRFPGQKQTCARCLQSSTSCKGKGIARKCELEGGIKTDFSNYILSMWSSIGYNPNTTKSSDEPAGEYVDQQIGGRFTPKKKKEG